MCPLFTCWVWAGQMGGYFLKVPTIYPLGMSQANCFRTHNELTMYPLGILPFAPSASCRGHGDEALRHHFVEIDVARS